MSHNAARQAPMSCHTSIRVRSIGVSWRTKAVLAVFLISAITSACKKRTTIEGDEALEVVAAERKLADQEAQLLVRRGALQLRRDRVRRERNALLSKKVALGETDPAAKAALEREESKLVELEAKLVKQELQLNQRLDALLEKKTGLVVKLGKGSPEAAEVLLVRRESSVAQREREIAKRETELASRERGLADREQVLATRQARLCGGVPSNFSGFDRLPPASAKSTNVSAKDVEPVLRKVRTLMQKKGVHTADLPAGLDRAMTETRHAISRGDYATAKQAADQLLRAVRAMKIDRNFIGTKIRRLSSLLKRNPPRQAQRESVQQLFQQATAEYSDGRFGSANRKLNKIYALLH